MALHASVQYVTQYTPRVQKVSTPSEYLFWIVFVFYCHLQEGMVMLRCLLGIPVWRQKHQIMNYSIHEETRESHLAVPVHLRHWTVQGHFSHLIGLHGYDYLAPPY